MKLITIIAVIGYGSILASCATLAITRQPTRLVVWMLRGGLGLMFLAALLVIVGQV